ncbi:hypothetical protein [Frankia sp. QA3]|uniref:hypothetical protein n=1 Tax=Frankia sp. QA3 TaxID=710111 RepID=UPI000269B8BC|nr:hypothetical protein [Frankia sp. QA3]EIV90825.1 hypothetical protein FraQA3DRAFT_0231 [Frankia sp. QA3]
MNIVDSEPPYWALTSKEHDGRLYWSLHYDPVEVDDELRIALLSLMPQGSEPDTPTPAPSAVFGFPNEHVITYVRSLA